jgi:hypothetical protein
MPPASKKAASSSTCVPLDIGGRRPEQAKAPALALQLASAISDRAPST